MSEQIESVNKIARLYRDAAAVTDGIKRKKHIEEAERLEAVSAELARLYGLTLALPPDLGNIYDLPPELQQELSTIKTDALEDQLVTVINAYGGHASLDQILVGLYRKFGVVQKRRFMQNKLYRMGTVWSVPGKKGLYTTKEPEPEPVQASESAADINGFLSPETHEDEEDMPFW